LAVSHRTIRLPAKTTSVGALSEALHGAIDKQWHREELPYWSAQLSGAASEIPGDRDHGLTSEEHGLEADQQSLQATLSPHLTRALTQHVAPSLGAGVHELLLSSFAAAFGQWSGLETLTINTCGIGRDAIFEQINLNRTVGELNTVYPLALLTRSTNLLRTTQETLAAVPANGLHYGMLRYIAAHETLQKAPEPAVFFNYVSRIDNTFAEAMGAKVTVSPAGVAASAPENRACYALYVEGSIQQDQLVLHLGYSGLRFSAASAQDLLSRWQAELATLQPAIHRHDNAVSA
ncbi:MAG: condensation domain-containing protein, partial [Pseudomonadales bacterium]